MTIRALAAGLRVDGARGNASWLTAERLVQLLVGFFVAALVARHLGAPAYGVLAFSLAVTALLSPFWSGTQNLVVRDLAAGHTHEGVVLGSALVVHTALTAVVAGLTASGLLLLPGVLPEGGLVPSLVVLSTVLLRPLTIFDYWFQAHLRAREAVAARLSAFLFLAVARVVAVAVGAPLAAFAALAAIDALLTGGALVLAYRRAGGRLRALSYDRTYVSPLSREAVPLLLTAISILLYMRIDQVMLGAMSGARETGLYAVAVTLSEVLFAVPVILSTVLMPGMTRLFAEDRSAYDARLQAAFSTVVGVGACLAATAAAVGPPLVRVVYGREYADAIPALLVLLATVPLVGLGVVQTIWSAHVRRQGLALARTGLAVFVNIGLNLLLIPPYGALGAAISTLAAYAVAAVFANALMPACWPVLRMQLRAFRLAGLSHVAWRTLLVRGPV